MVPSCETQPNSHLNPHFDVPQIGIGDKKEQAPVCGLRPAPRRLTLQEPRGLARSTSPGQDSSAQRGLDLEVNLAFRVGVLAAGWM